MELLFTVLFIVEKMYFIQNQRISIIYKKVETGGVYL